MAVLPGKTSRKETTMKNLITETEKNIKQAAKNCNFYLSHGLTDHFVNEAGVLRGMMYIADNIGCPYPFQEYYEMYIKPAAAIMDKSEPAPWKELDRWID